MTETSVRHETLVIERRYPVPPSRVFAAWADPSAHGRWFAATEGWAVGEYHHDFRVGGREEGRFAEKAGDPVFGNETRYYEISPAQRIVFAYTMTRDGRRISASLATVELLPDGDSGTRLIFTEQGAFLDGGDQARYREQGWQELLARLEREFV